MSKNINHKYYQASWQEIQRLKRDLRKREVHLFGELRAEFPSGVRGDNAVRHSVLRTYGRQEDEVRLHAHAGALNAIGAAMAFLKIAADGANPNEEATCLDALGAANRSLWCTASARSDRGR